MTYKKYKGPLENRIYDLRDVKFNIRFNPEPFIQVETPDDNDNIRTYNMPKEFFVPGIEKEDCMENTWDIIDINLVTQIKEKLIALGMTHSEGDLGVGG